MLICLQVAACICLFSLDKQEAIPVDTHVWQLAKQHYMPHLKGQLCAMVIVLAEGREEKGSGGFAAVCSGPQTGPNLMLSGVKPAVSTAA